MKQVKNILWIGVLSGAALFSACTDSTKSAETEQQTHTPTATYQCPMECEGDKVYESNVTCPVCHMDLKEVAQG